MDNYPRVGVVLWGIGNPSNLDTPTMALTDTKIKNTRPDAKAFKLADGDGLYLYITPQGSKLWRWKYRYQGKEKLMALGVYPAVPLAAARKLHRQGRELLAAGIDPMAARKAEKQADGLTFEAVAGKWFAHWKPERSERHTMYVWRRLAADVFPAIGKVPVGDLTAARFRDCVKAVEARGALDIAKRLLQTCSQVMRWAVANDLAERNPVADVRPSDILPSRKKRNYSRLDAKDLPQLLHDMDAYTGGEHTRLALQLMALTFVRTGELIGARWEEFDLDHARWDVPAERMKMKTPHIGLYPINGG